MSLEIMLANVIKDIGILTERINSLEQCMLNSAMRDDIDDDDRSDAEVRVLPSPNDHRLTFPVAAIIDDDSVLDTAQCRFYKSSMYKVKLLKPFMNETNSPVIMNIEMTRDELDDYLASNPGKNYKEYVISVQPLLEDML